MPEIAFLQDLFFVWLAALICGHLFHRFKQPMITGYILSGLLIGPFCLGLIFNQEHIHDLAELGVALLLFALGVELSLKQIFSASRMVIAAGLCQFLVTTAVGWSLAQAFGLTDSLSAGLLFGSICALSSTVVVTRVLGDRGEINSLHGGLIVAILIIQDLLLVPVMSVVPALQTGDSGLAASLLVAGGKAILLVALVFLGATRLVPFVLERAARSGSRELFLLSVMSVCLVTAVVSHELGMSVELGAFLAGIMVSESIYGHQALADVHPMKDLFSVVFFVTVGMMLNPVFLFNHWPLVAGFVSLLLLLKALIAFLAARLATGSMRVALLVGLGLAQIGEFSFVLAMMGRSLKIIDTHQYDLVLSGAVVTLIVSPFLLAYAPSMVRQRSSKDEPESAAPEMSGELEGLSNHIVLCGFGGAGHNLALVFQRSAIPFVVIEMNARLLEDMEVRGIPYIFGDASNSLILESAGIQNAAVLVVSITENVDAATIISTVSEVNPELRIVSRAHSQEEIELHLASGASAVVQPEYEASLELARLTLLDLDHPQVPEALKNLEESRYHSFNLQGERRSPERLMPFTGGGSVASWFWLDDPRVEGRSISSIDIRRKTGATVVAVRRNGNLTPYPEPDVVIGGGDELCVVGTVEQIARFESVLGSDLDLARFCPISERHDL